ncbi:MAG: hypothetical protein KJ007_17755 [Burkholderiales bacterium]|nr:hypothetical protein [Burkholderiales bacterium]
MKNPNSRVAVAILAAASLAVPLAGQAAAPAPCGKVILKPSEVAMHADWLRESGAGASRAARRVPAEDARRTVDAARDDLDRALEAAARRAGCEIVREPGEGVAELAARASGLYLNAVVGGEPALTRSWTDRAAEATLVAEMRDSRRGALLARVEERRETPRAPEPRLATPGAAAAALARLFDDWAGGAVRELLASRDRVPATGTSPRA